MKYSKYAYVLIAIIILFDFVQSLFLKAESHSVFFWEINIWGYRLFKLVVLVAFLSIFLKQKALKIK